jgi:ribose-phosphate pyrophosphokinase
MTTLLACPQMYGLAERIAAAHAHIQTAPIRWEYFKDGFPNLRVENIELIRNRHLAFLAAFDTPGDIFTQLSVIYEIPRYAVRSFKIVLPYYPTGTMERVDRDGQIATAATLAKMLSGVPMTLSGPAQVIIFDIHALQERFYFSDQVIPRLESGVPLLRDRLAAHDNLAIAFPDEGAWKRFGHWFQEYPLIVCHKIRKGGQRRISIREGDPAGKHVVIVDDLALSGGTLLACQRALKEARAAAVSAYVTHGVFPDKAWEPFLKAGFTHFWMTDSVPHTAECLAARPPFDVISLDNVIARLLMEGQQELS